MGLLLDEVLGQLEEAQRVRGPVWMSEDPASQTSRLHFLRGDLLAPETVRDALRWPPRESTSCWVRVVVVIRPCATG